MKNVCVCTLISRNVIFELVSKERAFPVRCCTNQTKLEVIFSSGLLLHPPSPVLPICFQIARAVTNKILRAINFPKKRFESLSTQTSYKLFFSLDLVSRLSEFRPVLFWSGLL